MVKESKETRERGRGTHATFPHARDYSTGTRRGPADNRCREASRIHSREYSHSVTLTFGLMRGAGRVAARARGAHRRNPRRGGAHLHGAPDAWRGSAVAAARLSGCELWPHSPIDVGRHAGRPTVCICARDGLVPPSMRLPVSSRTFAWSVPSAVGPVLCLE